MYRRFFSSLSPALKVRNPFENMPSFGIKQDLRFKIVESTLREGEQFSSAFFNTAAKIHIANTLDQMGIEYIEVVTPLASKQSAMDCETLARMDMKNAKLVTHTRCHMDDVRAAVSCGVKGVNLYMATSQELRKYSHGKDIDYIIDSARDVIKYCLSHNVEVRFSCEDTFRSDPTDVLRVYKAMEKLGVVRVGLADTVGVATPLQVWSVVSTVRDAVKCDIEFHVHNDTGCCIANALIAVQAGATHIDTCVLGIGERNGITPLGGLLARCITIDKDYFRSKYNLPLLRDLEKYVASKSQIDIPFNNYITGEAAFSHKAGVHSKAVMQNPGSYEVLDPSDFGVERQIAIAHRLTGWNAVKARAMHLKLNISDQRIKEATSWIKNLADTQNVETTDLDTKLREFATLEATEKGKHASV